MAVVCIVPCPGVHCEGLWGGGLGIWVWVAGMCVVPFGLRVLGGSPGGLETVGGGLKIIAFFWSGWPVSACAVL